MMESDPAPKSTASTKTAAAFAAIAGLGFGIPCGVGMAHLARTGEVWTFMGFPTYGKGPFEKVGLSTTTALMGAFLTVCTAEVVTAWLLWNRPRIGARASYALLPAEFVFWVGFALPFGPPLALGRMIGILTANRSRRAA